MVERKNKIQGDNKLPITLKCNLLDVSRSTLYYKAVDKEVDLEELEIKKLMDKYHLNHPYMGSRSFVNQLQRKGYIINRKRVKRCMVELNIRSTAPKPNTSKPGRQHKIYPYLLKNLHIDRSNFVWSTDITYIPMARGSLYLVAIMDWYS